MDEAITLLGLLQSGLMALLAAQTQAIRQLTAKVGELCGKIDSKKK